MKKIFATMFVVIILISFTACNQQTQATQELQETQATAEPTKQPQVDADQSNPEDVISKVLVDYQKIYEETKEDLISSNGQNIGTDADVREVADDGIKFIAQDGENPFMPLSKRLNDAAGTNNNNQAYYMKFKPSGKDFGVMLSDEVNVGITIGEENEPILFVMAYDYMEPLETDLKIEGDNWYHVIIAMGAKGIVQGAIWKEGQDDNVAYINLNINESFNDDRYNNKSWHVDVGYKGESTFTIESYAYYTYSNFVMEDRIIEIENNMLKNKDDVLFSMLMNPEELWSEGSGGFAENQGGEFGGGASEKRYNENEGRLEMFSDDIAACVPFNTTLRDCGSENRQQQAIIVKFQPENVTGFRFSFEAKDEVALSFREDGPYITDVVAFFEMPFSDYLPNNFEVKNTSIYYIFVAIDDNAIMRVFVWEEGMIENQAYLEYDLHHEDDDIFDSNWKMFVGFDSNGQFNIYEYWVYTFDNYMDGLPQFIMMGENQNNDAQNNDSDYGPSWAINIGGNFDIMSDMVWQSVNLQDINAGGDSFKGYGLKEMMEFSGNGSDSAKVVFGDNGGSDVEVSPTYDAYIVFKKNDEFLGGPFLFTVDGLSQHPVIEVHPN